MQAAGIPEAKSNSVRVEGNFHSGYLALWDLGCQEKSGKLCGTIPEMGRPKPQRRRGTAVGGQKSYAVWRGTRETPLRGSGGSCQLSAKVKRPTRPKGAG